MNLETKTCAQCGRRKTGALSASFTQWIFDTESCRCNTLNATNDSPIAGKIELCPTCGREVSHARRGSITQWIFRSTNCSCKRPEKPRIQTTSQSLFTTAVIPAQEEEILLDAKEFPVERYKAIALLGTGASGNVYLAVDRLLEKRVAIKTLRVVTSEQLISFQTEARAGSKLHHDAILNTLDFGPTDSGAPYMVLEYFEAITLAQFLQTYGPLSLTAFKSVFAQVTSALAHAHEMGVFHRDLKPSNILVSGTNDSDLVVKLIDFGIAQLKYDSAQAIVVQGRTLAGTPAYMPPDTVAGRKYDAQSEIYCLGCVLFESLTGRTPYLGETALEIVTLHAQAAIPTLSQVGEREYPSALEEIVATCLNKTPSERYASMAELNRVLGEIETAAADRTERPSTVMKTESSVPKKRSSTFAALTVGTIVIVGISFFIATQTFSSKQNASPNNRTTAKKEVISRALPEVEENLPSKFLNSNLTDAHAKYRLGYRFHHGDSMVTQDYKEAVKYYGKAGELGHLQAQVALAGMYETGTGVETNPKEALKWYRKAAEQGDATSQFIAATLSESVEKNNKEALKWYHKSAEGGNLPAQFTLAEKYAYGNGLPVNYVEAMKWYRKAAEQGHAFASMCVGDLYENGRGTGKSSKDAQIWYRKGVTLYRAAAEKGDPGSQLQLATVYATGHGVPKNVNEALKWYRKAAEKGQMVAQYSIAEIYLNGKGVPQDYHEAMNWFRKAADQGNADAMTSIGGLYGDGKGVDRDSKEANLWYQKAFESFRKAAEQGVISAQIKLSTAYANGWGVEKNIDEAIKWSLKAEEHGDHMYNQYQLGNLYAEKRNYSEALKWFRKAAALGIADANLRIGMFYDSGTGVKKDTQEAQIWFGKALQFYREAAENGDSLSQRKLANSYAFGQGAKPNYAEALKWYRRSAEQGDIYSQASLGNTYVAGAEGVRKNYKEALKWYRMAAEKGNPQSQQAIGKMYEDGLGVEKSVTEACRWYRLAAQQGDDEAKKRLDSLGAKGQ